MLSIGGLSYIHSLPLLQQGKWWWWVGGRWSPCHLPPQLFPLAVFLLSCRLHAANPSSPQPLPLLPFSLCHFPASPLLSDAAWALFPPGAQHAAAQPLLGHAAVSALLSDQLGKGLSFHMSGRGGGCAQLAYRLVPNSKTLAVRLLQVIHSSWPSSTHPRHPDA